MKYHEWYEQQRMGFVKIDSAMVLSSPNLIAEMISKIRGVVFRAEFLLHERVLEYAMMSPYFRPVALGEIIPLYELTPHFLTGELIAVSVKEVIFGKTRIIGAIGLP